MYDESLIPRFTIPKATTPPTVNGRIEPGEWKESVQLMGVVDTSSLNYKDRPVSFRVCWDDTHLYIAHRVDVLTGKTPHLLRAKRDTFDTGVVFDDTVEVGLFMHDRNRKEGEETSYLKFVVNSLGAGEYMKNYPTIGQVMFNWTPTFEIASQIVTDSAGKHWWEQEIAMDLDDLQMKVPHKAGDKIDIGLFSVVHNPAGWYWLDFPSASGHLEHFGFPRAVLTDAEPYVQVEEISGLHDERLGFKSVIHNPSNAAVKVDASLFVQHGPKCKTTHGELDSPEEAFKEARVLEIPAKGSVRFDVAKDLPGLKSADKGKGFLRVALERQGGTPVYAFACNFSGKDRKYATPVEHSPVLGTKLAFTQTKGLLALGVDTIDAPIPPDAKPTAATYKVTSGEKQIAAGSLKYFVNGWYDDLLELGDLPPGKYVVDFALVDASGKELATAKSGFEKKDAAQAFAAWWNNSIGNTEKVLAPFEPLEIQPGQGAAPAIACTRRVYQLGSLGLPKQIEANGGPLLVAPARIVVTIDGKEHALPADGGVKVTTQKDWRIDFEAAPVTVAGVTFSATGWMEQDGLVELALTYAPERAGARVAIEGLRVEWPVVEDPAGDFMACMGQGGNYSARTIGAVPKKDGSTKEGMVWNSRDDIGITGSGRRVGNFLGNLWVGSDHRGLFWCADSDRGWEPHADVPALVVKRERPAGGAGEAVVMVNNLVGTAAGKQPLALDGPRTVRFGYNASPFRRLQPGFRINQLSAAGSFSGGKYKRNWDTNQEFFTVLSPPFPDPKRWPEYYAHCKETVHKFMVEGWGADGGYTQFHPAPGTSAYYANRRYGLYTTNQIALRGYGYKSIENPNPYATFGGEWLDAKGDETLAKSYRDYMIWLMDRQVKEGGCQHFYFDISFGERLHRDLAAGFGYRLPDGRVQPEASDTNLREWYKRVWAMMEENGLSPGGVSGHATHGFSLKMLPFTSAILDSEYPMADPIDVYPSDARSALSCPHSFGTNVQHLGNFMNPTWPMMHDAAGGDYRGALLSYPEFKQWGMGRGDVEFIPYWRNQAVVKEIGPGLLASLWKRPGDAGSAVVAIMNYGPDPQGQGRTRPGQLTLDLAALGIPADAIKAGGDRVRIRQLFNCTAQNHYLRTLKWMEELKGKPLPPIQPTLDPATGAVGGFDVNYHDVK
ncbi:MAG: glycoside hydrolase domain-containing protein, partial [Planctomycetia bacterium]